MKGFSWGALIVVILGLLVVLTPFYLFPVCRAMPLSDSGASAPMKCFWTARAALGVGGMLVVSGLSLFFVKNPGTRLGLAFAPLCAGLLAILIPNQLIGVCPGETMPCHMGTLPALSVWGLFSVLAAVCIGISARRRMTDSGPSARRKENGRGPRSKGRKNSENGERA